MEMEGARIPRTKKENSNLKNISLCILFVLGVQVIIMLIPITTAGVIYTNNRENFRIIRKRPVPNNVRGIFNS